MSDVKRSQSATERDIELSVAFVNAFYEDVSILDDIPNGSTLVLLPDDDPELAEINFRSGIEAARNGADVYIRHFAGTNAPNHYHFSHSSPSAVVVSHSAYSASSSASAAGSVSSSS